MEKLASLKDELKSAVVYQISLPNDEKPNNEKAKLFLLQVLGLLDNKALFRIVAEAGSIKWEIVDFRTLTPLVDSVAQAVQMNYPQAQVLIKPFEIPEFTRPLKRATVSYLQKHLFLYPLLTIDDFKENPLIAITHAMSDLEEGERIVFSVYIDSFVKEAIKEDARRQIQRSEGGEVAKSLFWGTLITTLTQGKQKYESQPGTGRTGLGDRPEEEQQVMEQRLYDEQLYNCYPMVQVEKPLSSGSQLHRQYPIFTLIEKAYNYWNELVFAYYKNTVPEEFRKGSEITTSKQHWDTDIIGNFLNKIAGIEPSIPIVKAMLSIPEIAGLWHLPNEDFTAKEIIWKSKTGASKKLLQIQDGICLGDTEILGEKQPVYIHTKDRETHLYIAGRTGTGKSTFLHNLIHQDIKAGKGIAVLDPHGKLVRDILRLSIPEEREQDIVILDLANEDYPFPLNPLSSAGDDDIFSEEFIAILEKHEGPLPGTVDDALKAALATIRHENTPTLKDIVRLFNDAEYRYSLTAKVEFIPALEYWDYFEGLSIGDQKQIAKYSLRRIRKFYNNKTLYPTFCHPDGLDFEKLIGQQKVLLISLGVEPKKLPPNLSRLVGLVIVSQIQMAAMASFEQGDPFYFYIDEVQNYTTAPLPEIFNEARKFGLHLTVANQYLYQLGKVIDAVLGNVGTSIIFRIGQKDANLLKNLFQPEFEVSELVNMSKYHAAVNTQYLGDRVPPFQLATKPEPKDLFDYDLESEEAKEREEYLRNVSIRTNELKTRNEVEAWLKKRYSRKTYLSPQNTKEGDVVDWLVADEEEK